MKRRAVSLHDELQEVAHVLEGVRILAHLLTVEGFDMLGDAQRAPRVIQAMAGLSAGRLDLVCRCIRQKVDPRLLLAPHNDATDAPTPEGWIEERLRSREAPTERRRVRAQPRRGSR